MSTIKQVLVRARKKLAQAKITSADLDAEVLLSYILKKDKAHLYAHPEKNLSTEQQKNLTTLIARRMKNEPVAYLIKNKEFFCLDFYVDKRVLIPRPETEIIVEEVLKFAKTFHKPLAICDIGTGSGCIAVTLAKHLPKAKIFATDISKEALSVAKKNAKKHKVQLRIKFIQGDLLKPIKNKKLDIICANLPYLDKDYKNLLKSSDSKGLKFEPKIAWSGGNDGLNFYKKLFSQIKEFNLKNVTVFIEIGHFQKKNLKNYILQLFPQAKIENKKDLARKDRVLIIKL